MIGLYNSCIRLMYHWWGLLHDTSQQLGDLFYGHNPGLLPDLNIGLAWFVAESWVLDRLAVVWPYWPGRWHTPDASSTQVHSVLI
jgi:hypothetical protein